MNLHPAHARPETRALFAAVILILFGLVGILAVPKTEMMYALPFIIFYAALTVNTFFSLRFFATLAPHGTRAQSVIDAGLAVFYFALAMQFANAEMFLLITSAFFALTVIKYLDLARIIGHTETIHRKISVNNYGTLASLLALLATHFGLEVSAPVLWSLAFVAANIYLIRIRPLYKL